MRETAVDAANLPQAGRLLLIAARNPPSGSRRSFRLEVWRRRRVALLTAIADITAMWPLHRVRPWHFVEEHIIKKEARAQVYVYERATKQAHPRRSTAAAQVGRRLFVDLLAVESVPLDRTAGAQDPEPKVLILEHCSLADLSMYFCI